MNKLFEVKLIDINVQDYLARYWSRKYGESTTEYSFRMTILTAYNQAVKCAEESIKFDRLYLENVQMILEQEWQEILRGWNEIINS